MFEDISNQLKAQLDQLSEKQIHLLQTEFPGLPNDYLSFIKRVGFGNIGEIQIYSGPISPDEVYPHVKELGSIILFGDDHQGYCFGFDLIDEYRVVEVDPNGLPDRSIEPDFLSLILGYFNQN